MTGKAASIQTQKPAATAAGVLQRKCACGNHSNGGECESCAKKTVQRKLTSGASSLGNGTSSLRNDTSGSGNGVRDLKSMTGLRLGAPNDPLETEADHIADQVLGNRTKEVITPASVTRVQRDAAPFADTTATRIPESVDRTLADSGSPLPMQVRGDMETRFGHDFSNVRIHLDRPAAESARAIQARAYTVNNHIVFGTGHYAPQSPTGRQLLAHELTHVLQQSGNILRRAPSKGEAMTDAADKWLQTDSAIKVEVDKLKAALKEMKKGKSLVFNKKSGASIIDTLAKLVPLNAAKTTELKAAWIWLADNAETGKAGFQQKQKSFLADLQSPLSQVSQQHPKSQAKFWLKNTPPQVADLLYTVADSDLPVEELYVYAAREGMIELVRDRIGLGKTDTPSKAQLKTFDTSKKVDGFHYLGADDFMTELDAKRDPMRNFLPKGYDLSVVKEVKHINEKNREVRSAEFPNLLMAIQGLAAILKRRRKLFLEDAKANKYATPTREELVYWTYVYYNTGEFGSKAQLEKYKGKRKLSDWITAKEYPNSMVVLDSYKMLKSMDSKAKIF